jgi:hypothetical protein
LLQVSAIAKRVCGLDCLPCESGDTRNSYVFSRAFVIVMLLFGLWTRDRRALSF